MELEIHAAEDKGSRMLLHMSYDEEFEAAVKKILGGRISKKAVEQFIMLVLESVDPEELDELRNKIAET
jgi:hypothetical protein